MKKTCPNCNVEVNSEDTARSYGNESPVYINGFCSAGCYTKFSTHGPNKKELSGYRVYMMKAQNTQVNDIIIFPPNVERSGYWIIVHKKEIVKIDLTNDFTDIVRITDQNNNTHDFGRRVEFEVIRWYIR